MNITLLTVGSLKESWWRDAVREYEKRLSAYCRLKITEVRDEKTPDGASEAAEEQIRVREGKRLLEKIKDRSFVVLLDIHGTRYDSEGFSAMHERWETESRGDLVFIIGGSLGVSQTLIKRADMRWKLSDNTFPHQLCRIIVLEQIYRSFRILRNEPYHK